MGNNNTGSLDTNVLLRMVVGDVPEQTTLINTLFKQKDYFHVSDIVIFEMVFVLDCVYKFSREDIIETVYTVIRNEKINCNRKLFELALHMYSENAKLSFVDCTLPHYAMLNNASPLYTFDKELAKKCPKVTAIGE